MKRLGSLRAYLAVGGATAVLAACLAAGPLFLSTASTAATRLAMSGRCPGLVDASFLGPHDRRTIMLAKFDQLAPRVPYSGRPLVTDFNGGLGMTLPRDDGVFRSASIVHRTGWRAHLDIQPGAQGSGAYVPDWFAAQHNIRAGQMLTLRTQGTVRGQRVRVAGVYGDVVAGRQAPFWCHLEPAFQANAFGDHKSPVLILDDATAARASALFGNGSTRWELPLAGRPSATSTKAYLDHLGPLQRTGQRLADRYFEFPFGQQQLVSEVEFVVRRATEIRSFTGASIAPVRWSGALTGGALVLAAALLFARRNRREYRIRVLRGTRGARLGLQAATRIVPVVAIGAALGAGAAALSIRAFGPARDLSRGAVEAAGAFAALAAIVTLVVVALTVTLATRPLDRARTTRRTWLKRVPFELAAAAFAFFAFRHLADTGGVKLAGADASPVDPWAVLFPLLLVWTVLIALGRPLLAVLKRLRTRDLGVRPSVQLGLRRALADPLVGVVTTGAVAFCLATFVYASTLSTSIDASLRAKAHTAVGADLRVAMTTAPNLAPSIAHHATLVTRGQGSYGGASVTVLGVDRSTFAKVAFWRRSFGGSLGRLLASLRAPAHGALPIVIAGDAASSAPASGRVGIDQGSSATARVVERIHLLPTMQPGDTFVLADKAALARRGLKGVDEVWIKGLPTLAPSALAGRGVGVLYSIDLASVLDSDITLPVRWSLGLLGALGGVAGLAFASVELAMVDSRARARQLGYLLLRRMGLSARQHRVACAIELGLPVLAGAIAAVVVSVATARLVIAHLDALESLPPSASFAPSAEPFVVGAAAVLVVVAALVSWSQLVTRSGEPLELIRVAE